jgi:hypothetical protein
VFDGKKKEIKGARGGVADTGRWFLASRKKDVRHDPRQEPSALAVHAGICAGGAG